MGKVWQVCHHLVHGHKDNKLRPLTRQRGHARRRYEERFKRELSKEEYSAVVLKIQQKRGYFLEDVYRSEGYVRIWCVEVQGEDAVAFYDEDTKQIRTFYTLDMWEERVNKRGRHAN